MLKAYSKIFIKRGKIRAASLMSAIVSEDKLGFLSLCFI